ncbi:MAG: hypothetical protein LAO19_13880 [Acidobacteriia bacterium]|nr:hypothetical protein [Terriglobia bacterium]
MPPKPTNIDIDADLGMLERDIRQLKIEFEQYFGGGRKKPPSEIEWRIETMVKRYGDRGADMNYGQRFRYGNLVQMYSKIRDMFRKRMKAKEEGIVQRHFGAAAREIEKERAAKQAAAAKSSPAPHFPFSVSCKDPDQELKKVEELFEAFRAAKETTGEKSDSLSREAFQEFVRKKTDQIKQQTSSGEVEYIVSVEGAHVRLKARPKS